MHTHQNILFSILAVYTVSQTSFTHSSQHMAYLNFSLQNSPSHTILAICAHEHLLRFLVLVSDLSIAQVSKAACCVLGFLLCTRHVAILFWRKSSKLFHMQFEHPCYDKSTGLWVHTPCSLTPQTMQMCVTVTCHQRWFLNLSNVIQAQYTLKLLGDLSIRCYFLTDLHLQLLD